jgi:hypothetical protein
MDPVVAARFLYESGLLFEINRAIMHPNGLALAVSTDDRGAIVGFAGIQDHRAEEHELLFAKGSVGKERLIKFQNECGGKYLRRQKKMGYVVQPIDSI